MFAFAGVRLNQVVLKSLLEPLGRFSFYGVGLLWFYRDEISRFAWPFLAHRWSEGRLGQAGLLVCY